MPEVAQPADHRPGAPPCRRERHGGALWFRPKIRTPPRSTYAEHVTAEKSSPCGLNDSAGGFLELLGISIDEAGPDRVVLSMDVGPEHLQPQGITHGGVHATLVESAASIGGHLWIGATARGSSVVGVANNTDFLRASTGGRLVATANPIHRGRSQQLWLVEITDVAGKLIARGQVRLHNMNAA